MYGPPTGRGPGRFWGVAGTDRLGDADAASSDEVVLVDLDGKVVGATGKLAAHEAPGRLHLAFSVLLFDGAARTLLQRRAAGKYHFPGHWANACCSHPRPGESVDAAAHRRLAEELGMGCDLEDVGSFVYRAVCPSGGLVEHELDHVLVGVLGEGRVPKPDPGEVDDWRWVDVEGLAKGEAGLPGPVAPWLVPALLLARRARPLVACGA